MQPLRFCYGSKGETPSTNRGELARVAYWMIFAGVISALAAAVFGLTDWLGIPSGTRAKAIGAWAGRWSTSWGSA